MKWYFKVFQACSKEGKDNLKFKNIFPKYPLKRIFQKFRLMKISSYTVLVMTNTDASGSVVHIGYHPVSSFHQPQSFRLGSSGMRVLDRGWWYTCIFHWQSEMRMKVSD